MKSEALTFEQIISDEKALSYIDCNRFWENEHSKVHSDTSDGLMEEIADHVRKRMELNKNDVLLVIGGGGGYIDRFLSGKVKKLLSIDFSEKKIIEAKGNNPEGEYFKQDFLKKYDYLREYGVNKIYSYSVMQYCKPKDVKTFFANQLSVLDMKKKCRIGHLDVPDVDKAFYYYNSLCEDCSKQKIYENRDKIKYLIGDGSCWHDMDQIQYIAGGFSQIKKCSISKAHYWQFRSDIVLEVV